MTEARSAGNVLVAAASLVIVVAALRAARDLLLPLAVSMFLAALTAPVIFWLRDRRVQPAASIPLVMVAFFLLISLLGGFIVSSVNGFIAALPRYQERVDTLVLGATSLLSRAGIELDQADLGSSVQPSAVMKLAARTLKEMAGMLSNTLLVLLTTVLILFEATGLAGKIRRAFADPNKDLSHLSSVAGDIKNYVLLKTYTSLATGVLVALVLWALGVDFALLWGLFAFLFNYVPNIGSIIAALPPVLLAWVQYGTGRAALAAGAIVVINVVIGNVVEPRVMGRSLGLSTLVVFLSLVFWGWVWGPVGMLLSIPLTMVVKIALEHSERLGWVAVMLGEARPADETLPTGTPSS